jgi:hypothetical protein
MVGVVSLKRAFAHVKRGFEFSRLHEEWMASAYTLVVHRQQHGSDEQRARRVACGKSDPCKSCLITDQEVKHDA